MKQGWQLKKLVEVCLVERGSSPRPIEKYFTNSNEGVNWIKIGDTKGIDKYIYSTKQKITKEGAKQSRFVKEGDFILSNSMSYGQPYIMKTTGYIHDGWFALRLPDNIDTEFFYHLLTSPNVQEQFKILASGSVVKNISGDLVKKVNLMIPPLTDQKEIVNQLNKVFIILDKAKSNAQQNLKNAKELFDSYLQSVFETNGNGWEKKSLGEVCSVIGGGTPSKANDKFYAGNIYWATVRDMKGDIVNDTEHKITLEAVKKSSTNIIPKGNVIIATRVGLGRICLIANDTAINQDLRGVVPNDPAQLSVKFLYRWFKNIAHKIVEEGTGATVQGVKLPFIKSLSIYIPSLKEQKSIIKKIDAISAETKKLEAIYQQKINDLEELKKSILKKAFSGELKTGLEIITKSKAINQTIPTIDLHAGIIALAFQRHIEKGNANTFHHVKSEKIIHMTESHLGVNLKRKPIKDAAGPNDFACAKLVEANAKKENYFKVEKKDGMYVYSKGTEFDNLISKVKTSLNDQYDTLVNFIDIMVPWKTEHAEIFATVYAAWNNLLLDKKTISDEAIVYEARENWHTDKLKIDRTKFFKMITWMKNKSIIPTGSGKKVLPKK